MDVHTREQRSRNMASIKSKDTKPEKVVRSLLHAAGFRYRLHRKDLPGSPDIVLPKYKAVVFVHGCFWHRHEGCKYASEPKTNIEFWSEKFKKNCERDSRVQLALKNAGWHVVIVWACEVKDKELLLKRLNQEIRL